MSNENETLESKLKLKYDELELPNYINNHPAMSINGYNQRVELTITDVIKAAVLSGLNLMFVSDTGGGKTQLMSDIYNGYFGGDIKEKNKGHGIWITARKDTEVMGSILSKLNPEKFARELKKEKFDALLCVIDELNRAPGPSQNDFFDLANGKKEFQGEEYSFGSDGYFLCMAAVNLERINGDYSGTFQMDRALMSRMHLAVDFDYFKTTEKDRFMINKGSNPKVKLEKNKDVSKKVLNAFKEINAASKSYNPYIDAYLAFIQFGLENCTRSTLKDKNHSWPGRCGDCDKHPDASKLCHILKQPEQRSVLAVKKLVYGLDYLIKLKYNKNVDMDPADLVFNAFKFTAYHGCLNTKVSDETYESRDQYMMNDVVDKLRVEFNGIVHYMNYAIDLVTAKSGNKAKDVKWVYFKSKTGNDIITTEAGFQAALEKEHGAGYKLKTQQKIITLDDIFTPFETKTGISMGWFKTYLDVLSETKEA